MPCAQTLRVVLRLELDLVCVRCDAAVCSVLGVLGKRLCLCALFDICVIEGDRFRVVSGHGGRVVQKHGGEHRKAKR